MEGFTGECVEDSDAEGEEPGGQVDSRGAAFHACLPPFICRSSLRRGEDQEGVAQSKSREAENPRLMTDQ